MGSALRSAGIVVAIAFATLVPGAAGAQGAQGVQSGLTLNGRTFALSQLEQSRLLELSHLVHGADRGVQDRALAAAEAVVNSPDGRFVLALYQLEIGRQRRDDALRARALDVLIAQREVAPAQLASYLAARGDIAFRAHDDATASALWGRLAEMQPGNPQVLVNLAQVREAQGDHRAAVAFIHRAIGEAGQGTQPEALHRQWLAIAYNAALADESVAAARALVAAYPTADNWRFALVAYRQLAAPQSGAEIDLYRLMRAVGVLAHADEYRRLTQLLLHAGFAAEAKAVLDEGVSRGIVNGTEAPIPDIRREIERALQHPQRPALPVQDSAASFHMAVGLALAGRRSEAETAFRAIAGNANAGGRFYPDLAGFWLLWFARPA